MKDSSFNMIQTLFLVITFVSGLASFFYNEYKNKKLRKNEEKEKILKRLILDNIEKYKEKFEKLNEIQDLNLTVVDIRNHTDKIFKKLMRDIRICKIYDEKYKSNLHSKLLEQISSVQTKMIAKVNLDFVEVYYEFVRNVYLV